MCLHEIQMDFSPHQFIRFDFFPPLSFGIQSRPVPVFHTRSSMDGKIYPFIVRNCFQG